MWIVFSLLTGCAGSDLACGPGTEEQEGLCVPAQSTSPTTDNALPAPVSDSGDSTNDTGEPKTDTDDTGENKTDPDDSGSDSGTDDAQPILVYLLAGQSNMVGVGHASSLPTSLQENQEDVWLYWSGVPQWQSLQPASAYSSTWGLYMGPEVPFGRAMADAHPDRQVALIKHADGGTALADWWYPGTDASDTESQGAGYSTFITTVQEGLANLAFNGHEVEIGGMIWMQGESDACYDSYAQAYQANLTHFIDRVREDTETPDMPFMIGEIHCYGVCAYRDTVIAAEQAVAAKDPLVRSFTTLDLEMALNDPWHYGGIGQRILGERFAQAMLDEPEMSAYPTAAVTLTGSYSYDYYGAFTVGWAFSTHEELVLTDLGVFDLDSDGLYHSTEVAIWEESTGLVLAEANVPSSSLDVTDWFGGWRYVGIDPVVLAAGEYVIGNVSYSWTPDYYVYAAETDTAQEMSWTESRHVAGSALTLPTEVSTNDASAAAWFGPNFLFASEPVSR